MSQKLEPFDAIKDSAERKFFTPPKDGENALQGDENPPKDGENPPLAPQNRHAPQRSTAGFFKNEKYDVFVFFYNPDEKTVSVISNDSTQAGYELAEIAEGLSNLTQNFGKKNGLYYLKQNSGKEIKIAVAKSGIIRMEMFKLFLLLLLIFSVTMLIFFFISRYIANLATKPLKESIEREKQFITDISHDLKTPVTAIIANASILEGEFCQNETNKWIGGIKTAAGNMKSLLEEMLVLSKSELAREKTEKINLSDIAEECALVMESAAYEKNINFHTDIKKDIFINGAADSAKRIISALIDNAVKYENKGGSVTVSLSQNGQRAVFCTRNKLSFISKDDIEHIFERFYRSDKSRHSNEGHGLGLSIVKNLTEALGGKINAQSSETDGTTFTVTFPAVKK